MNQARECRAELASRVEGLENASGLFCTDSVLRLLKLILAGTPLPEVLTIIAQLVESQGNHILCTIWLPEEGARSLYCAAAPSLPEFRARVGRMVIGPKGGSCGTAVYRREPVYATDVYTDPHLG